ncbi:MAG: hypothetical protein D6776_12205, partial [Planctomycetota bacterium]
AVEIFATAMAGAEGAEVAREFERLLGRERQLRGAETLRVDADGEVVRVAGELPDPDAVVFMLIAAGGRRVRVFEYPDPQARERWSPFGREAHALPDGVRARPVDAWGPKPRILMPTVAAAAIALSLERLGVLVWQAALALFVLLFVAVLALAGRQSRLRVEWYAIEEATQPG